MHKMDAFITNLLVSSWARIKFEGLPYQTIGNDSKIVPVVNRLWVYIIITTQLVFIWNFRVHMASWQHTDGVIQLELLLILRHLGQEALVSFFNFQWIQIKNVLRCHACRLCGYKFYAFMQLYCFVSYIDLLKLLNKQI